MVLANLWQRVRDAAVRIYRRRTHQYWATAAAIVVVAAIGTPLMEDFEFMIRLHYTLFQKLSEVTPRLLTPRQVSTVIVGDNEYFNHLNEHLDSGYLAKIVTHLTNMDAHIIALDFNFALKGEAAVTLKLPDQRRQKTEELIKAIERAAQNHPVILVRSMDEDENRHYILVPDIYQIYGICTGVDEHGHWQNPGLPDNPDFSLTSVQQANIDCGYIALSDDMMLLPPRLPLASGERIDAFSFAIVRAQDEELVENIPENRYFVNYISEEEFHKRKYVVAAQDVINETKEARKSTVAKAVIVGVGFHAVGSNELVDGKDTPVGKIPGVLIHANFSEAMLDTRLYPPIARWIAWSIEILVGFLAGVTLALVSGLWRKSAIFGGMALGLVLLQYVLLQNVGMVVDAFIPLIGLFVHSALEGWFGHGKDADAHHKTA